MKDWWMQLSLKEKQMVSFAGIFASLFLLYELVWSPIMNKTDSLRANILRNQRLLSWMQDADQRLSKLTQATNPPTSQKASLLSSIQAEMQQHDFTSAVTALQQTENNTVQLRLQKIEFDKVIQWLTAFCQQHAVKITQMTVHPSGTSGIVDIELKLQN